VTLVFLSYIVVERKTIEKKVKFQFTFLPFTIGLLNTNFYFYLLISYDNKRFPKKTPNFPFEELFLNAIYREKIALT